jgi:hypothetical protein
VKPHRSVSAYRDTGGSIRGPRSQTIGSAKAMQGRTGTVEEMRTAAADTSRFKKVWKKSST